MKKIFYKIFFTLLIITYIPLVLLYSFHGLYMKQYVENKKISELSEITYIINKNTLNSLKAGEKEELEKKKDIKIEVIDAREDGYKIFEYFNRKVWKIDLKKLKVNDTRIRFERVSNLLDRIYIIKKVDRNKYVIISSLMVIPDVIYRTILSSYFYVTPFLVVIILILAYFISKKMAVPIEVLEDISTRVLNLDFSKSIDFKGKDELKILNKKLKYELEKNQKFMKFEKEFINSVSHELKTPIAIINGYIEVLQDKIIINEEEIEKIYSVMYKEGLYLDKMIKDLNSYHSYEHEFFTIKKERFNFKEFLQSVLNKYLLDIEEKNIKLKIDIEDKIIEEDLQKIDVVVNNLLTNSITYVDTRAIINIVFKNNILTIENSCEYISEENMERIFKPFYKLDFSRKRKYGGTGLGLSIVKNILDLLQYLYKVRFDKERGFFIFQINFK